MAFLAQSWLLLLAPFAALVVLVLRSYRPKVAVPFLDLWPREKPERSRNRGFRVPPPALWLMLMAVLAGILGLARPAYWEGRAVLHHVTIVVDRGIAMLTGGRLERARGEVLRELPGELAADASIDVVDDENRRTVVGPAGLAGVLAGEATAVDTRERVAAIVRRLVEESRDPILLLGEPVANVGDQVRVVCPGQVRNVGIAGAAAEGEWALVTVRNESDLRRVAVVLRSGLDERREEVELPPAGELRQYTLACPRGRPMEIRLDVTDDLADDDTFWVLPKRSARLEVAAGLPREVQRFAERYAAVRPAEQGAVEVRFVTAQTERMLERSVVIAEGEMPVAVGESAVLPDHPLLANVHLPTQVMAARSGPTPLADGAWQVLWKASGVTLLAVDEGHRRVWVGFASEAWSGQADFPIFWANVVEYLAGGQDEQTRPRSLDGSWKRIDPAGSLPREANGLRQGLYQRAEELAAVNVPSPALGRGVVREGPLVRVGAERSYVDVAGYMWCVAGGLMAGAMWAVGLGVKSQDRS